jgi:hypothetical protein
MTSDPTIRAKSSARPDALGLALIAILLALLISAWVLGMSTERPAPSGPGPVFMGFFLLALGFMFLASYFYAGKSFFLRWLLRLAMGFPGMGSPKMAFFFSFLCMLTGLSAIADGLGFRILI